MSGWKCNGVKFKVGGKVKIVRKVETHDKDGMGVGKEWMNSWNRSMKDYIGQKGRIESITDHGVSLEDTSYSWPLAALELLSLTPTEKLAKKIAKAAAMKKKLESLNNEISKLKRKLA
jgi:hypothetical protein